MSEQTEAKYLETFLRVGLLTSGMETSLAKRIEMIFQDWYTKGGKLSEDNLGGQNIRIELGDRYVIVQKHNSDYFQRHAIDLTVRLKTTDHRSFVYDFDGRNLVAMSGNSADGQLEVRADFRQHTVEVYSDGASQFKMAGFGDTVDEMLKD